MGLLNQPSAKFDGSVVDTLHNHLFEFESEDGSIIALDLPATNINRGRDHGIPSYSKYVEWCHGGIAFIMTCFVVSVLTLLNF